MGGRHRDLLTRRWRELNERVRMPTRVLPRIVSVAPGAAPLSLRIAWDSGDEGVVDLSGHLGRFRVYEPLRRSPELFARAAVGEHGTDVVWTETSTSRRTRCGVVPGAIRPHHVGRRLPVVRERKSYSLDAAARALVSAGGWSPTMSRARNRSRGSWHWRPAPSSPAESAVFCVRQQTSSTTNRMNDRSPGRGDGFQARSIASAATARGRTSDSGASSSGTAP